MQPEQGDSFMGIPSDNIVIIRKGQYLIYRANSRDYRIRYITGKEKRLKMDRILHICHNVLMSNGIDGPMKGVIMLKVIRLLTMDSGIPMDTKIEFKTLNELVEESEWIQPKLN